MSYALGVKAVLVIAILAAAGCGSKDAYDAVIDDLDALATRMCACVDTTCADKVQDEARAYRRTIQDKIGRDTKDRPTEAQEARGRAADERLRACRKKLDPIAAPAPAPAP